MNLTTRSKWLTGVAAAVAAWVFFGPKDSDPTDATAGSTHAAAHPSRATAGATAARTARRAPHTVGERVADATAAGALFAAHSWYVAPPPPPPVVDAPPAPPPKPTAPPLPFKFIGSYTPDGEKTVFFLSAGDKVHDVHIGDTVDNTYSVDSYNNGQLVLTYKPLNQQQQLQLTGTDK
ncbi:MAG TPA: hypothetical protein VE266_09195 [Steroidobacteraceae bacterium]|nr:hypothetical protein [Steroidobacteraceae bacterium]